MLGMKVDEDVGKGELDSECSKACAVLWGGELVFSTRCGGWKLLVMVLSVQHHISLFYTESIQHCIDPVTVRRYPDPLLNVSLCTAGVGNGISDITVL